MVNSHRARYAGEVAIGRVTVVAVLLVSLLGGVAYATSRVLAGAAREPVASPAGEKVDVPAATETTSDAARPAGSSPEPSVEASGGPTPAPTTSGSAPGGGAQPATTTTTKKAPPPAAPAGPVQDVLELVNAARSDAGCQPVALDTRLNAAAQAHSADMAANNYFSHTGRDGSSVSTRVTRAQYSWSAVGENIAKGQPNPQAVMQAWMNSSGHKANILNCGFRHLGVGLATSGGSPVWTQNFGTPQR